MKVEQTHIPGVVVLTPDVYGDHRGFFMETFNARTFKDAGLPTEFVQDNHSRSAKGVLRGLHFQYPQWQGKLVRVLSGAIFDVAVDVRKDSPHFGQWIGVTLDSDTKQQLYVPPGFAHGFCVLSDIADVSYKCTTLYKPEDEISLRYDDPDVGIQWPIDNPALSEKDANGLWLKDINIV